MTLVASSWLTFYTLLRKRAFPVAAAKVWNMLPPAITSLSSLEAFKRALKTELFRRSYGSEVFFKTCVAMKFVDDDDDDDRWLLV